MAKLKVGDLDAIRNKYQEDDGQWIKVGMSTSGLAAGAEEVYRALVEGLESRGIELPVRQVGSLGMGYAEPLVEIKVDGAPQTVYGNVDADVAEWLLDAHVSSKRVVEKFRIEGLDELTWSIDEDFAEIKKKETRQLRIVMRNCGVIDPTNIDEYIGHDGYLALRKVLVDQPMQPIQVIEEVRKSRLRGRGGGGYSTGQKWLLTREAQGEEKFVICNGDEGDPGAYMDRSILEDDPHSVIEGMVLAGYAIGATTGFCYIRAEYPLAIDRMEHAIRQAKRYGLLGKKILGTDFEFNLEVRLGAGAFVCGEETALIASIEGQRGTPRPRPPYPSVRGLWNSPASINNVETFANIAPILMRGGEWFASIGTEESKGTKVFALTGEVAKGGLVEVPMGTPLRDIIFKIGGGTPGGRRVKAVQTGGPSGGVIPEKHLDTPVSYEHLQELGSIMGSGGMIAMDENSSMVDIAKFYLGFCVDESCGKCAPCRIGGKQLLMLLEKISEGKGEEKDIEHLREISRAMQRASLCGLGQTAPNPVVSTLRFFEDEYRSMLAQAPAEAAS